MGERVSVKRPKRFYLDQVTPTAGYLGDLEHAERLPALRPLGRPQLHAAARRQESSATARGVRRLDGVAGVEPGARSFASLTRETHAIDAVRLELYQRTTGRARHGFAVSAERMLPHKLALAGGFATIDRNYAGLNGDRFNRGKRMFVEQSCRACRTSA